MLPNINDAFVAKFKVMFQLSNVQAGLVQFAFFMNYALFLIPAGLLLKRIGFMRGFMLEFLIIAAVYGLVADVTSLTAALFVLVICYATIVSYGIYTNRKPM